MVFDEILGGIVYRNVKKVSERVVHHCGRYFLVNLESMSCTSVTGHHVYNEVRDC